jgi:hypothetical protein
VLFLSCKQRRGTARTLPYCYLCCSMYCLCVNVHCHRVTTQLQLINISTLQWLRQHFPATRFGTSPSSLAIHSALLNLKVGCFNDCKSTTGLITVDGDVICLYNALYSIFPGLIGVSFSTTRIDKETDVVYFKILPQTQLRRAVVGSHPNRESNPPTFKYEELQCPIIKLT